MGVDREKTLTWLNALCQTAEAKAKEGDLLLLNSFEQHAPISSYFNNVHTRRAMSAQTWASFAGYLEYVDNLRVKEEAEAAREAQISALESRSSQIESKLDEMMKLIQEIAGSKPDGDKGK